MLRIKRSRFVRKLKRVCFKGKKEEEKAVEADQEIVIKVFCGDDNKEKYILLNTEKRK